MVQANVDNTPVSIHLGTNSSTTVPSGETWVVTVIGYVYSTSGNGELFIKSGSAASGIWIEGGSNVNQNSIVMNKMVLTAGDAVETSSDVLANIHGFKV